MSRIPMTAHGAKQLEQTLYSLKTEARPRVIKSIEEARAHGDLKENAEYHAAKEEQGFIERRILEIESKLSHAQIIDVSRLTNSGKVVFGSKLYLIDTQNGEKLIYHIVGEDEADIKIGKISFNSPLARALIGKEVGDTVAVTIPSGEQSFEVDKVEYI